MTARRLLVRIAAASTYDIYVLDSGESEAERRLACAYGHGMCIGAKASEEVRGEKPSSSKER